MNINRRKFSIKSVLEAWNLSWNLAMVGSQHKIFKRMILKAPSEVISLWEEEKAHGRGGGEFLQAGGYNGRPPRPGGLSPCPRSATISFSTCRERPETDILHAVQGAQGVLQKLLAIEELCHLLLFLPCFWGCHPSSTVSQHQADV